MTLPKAKKSKPVEKPKSLWTFLSNHTHVLISIYRDSEMTVKDMASLVGITERAVLSILQDLEREGYLVREKTGRRNRYKVVEKVFLRHPLESHKTIGDLLKLLK